MRGVDKLVGDVGGVRRVGKKDLLSGEFRGCKNEGCLHGLNIDGREGERRVGRE